MKKLLLRWLERETKWTNEHVPKWGQVFIAVAVACMVFIPLGIKAYNVFVRKEF